MMSRGNLPDKNENKAVISGSFKDIAWRPFIGVIAFGLIALVAAYFYTQWMNASIEIKEESATEEASSGR